MAKRDVGKKLVERLAEFHDAMVAGEEISRRFHATVRESNVPQPRPFGRADVVQLRKRLDVRQAVFAQVVGVSPVLARQWESGVRKPSPLACRLFELIERQPEVVSRLLIR